MKHVISSFYAKEGNIAVEGFCDKVVPATPQEKDMMKKIPYAKADDMKILGITAKVGDTTFSSLERIWFRPTFEIIELQSSYTTIDGRSNIISGNAMVRITCRLVNNQFSKQGVVQKGQESTSKLCHSTFKYIVSSIIQLI